MKYLITTQPISSSQSPDTKILQTAKKWIESRLKDGTFDNVFSTIPRGGVFIANAESPEELWDLLISYPLYQYLNIKVSPLVSYQHVFNRSIDFVKDNHNHNH